MKNLIIKSISKKKFKKEKEEVSAYGILLRNGFRLQDIDEEEREFFIKNACSDFHIPFFCYAKENEIVFFQRWDDDYKFINVVSFEMNEKPIFKLEMKIIDKFEQDFNNAENVAEGLKTAFDNLPENFFEKIIK